MMLFFFSKARVVIVSNTSVLFDTLGGGALGHPKVYINLVRFESLFACLCFAC